MIASFRAPVTFGTSGWLLEAHAGDSRMKNQTASAATTSTTAISRCVDRVPIACASRGVANAETAVPIMPMPNTPVAKPRCGAGYHALENGTPTAKIVPATPSRNPAATSSG